MVGVAAEGDEFDGGAAKTDLYCVAVPAKADLTGLNADGKETGFFAAISANGLVCTFAPPLFTLLLLL